MSEDKKEGGLFVDSRPAGGGAQRSSAKKDVRKRWLILGGGVLAFSLVISTMLSRKPPTFQAPQKAPAELDLTPKGVAEKSWQVQSQAEIQDLKNQNAQLQSTLNGVQSALTDLKTQLQSAKQPEASLPAGVVPPPGAPSTHVAPIKQAVPPPPLPPAPVNLPPPTSSQNAVPPPFTSAPANNAPLVFAPTTASTLPVVKTDVRYRRNPDAGLLVAGSFAPVVLLNGIDAGTSSTTRSNPEPVLMRIQNNAVLPGSAHYALRTCFVLGSGYGDLSSERVYIRLARLSCIDVKNRLVLTAAVQGYVVDSDNTLGFRGKVIDRQGAKLGKALIAGFAEGLSSALGGSQGTLTTSALGMESSITGSEALHASGLTGAGTAAGEIADFYLKEAQNIFPVISIKGGRTGTLVFTKDTNLTWGNVNGQFVKDVRPETGSHGF